VTPGSGLVVRGLRKSYRRRPVIRDVSLYLAPGEVVALLGPNGSGKTTCFYAVAGLVAAEGGEVSIDGQDVTRLPMYRRAQLGLGYLPQEMSIFRGLSVEDNVLAILEIAEPSPIKRRARLEELLDEFGVAHLRRAPALALSGGERRRVEIARCLAASPAYVLLDEPFAGVDPIAVGEIRGLVEGLRGRGIGVLITDHNVRETLGLVDRAYILHDGRVLMSGTVAEVVRDEDVRRVYLGQGFGITTGAGARARSSSRCARAARGAPPPAAGAAIDRARAHPEGSGPEGSGNAPRQPPTQSRSVTMRIQVSGKQVDVGEALRSHVTAGLEEAAAKYAGRPTEAAAVFSRDGHAFSAEVTVHLSTGLTAQARARTPTPTRPSRPRARRSPSNCAATSAASRTTTPPAPSP
jgi:lipopolysaccharide export system ATP-binding protein